MFVAALVRVWRRFCIAGLQTFTLFHYDTTQGIVTVLLFLLPLAGSISDVIDYNRAGLTLQPVERACCCCLSFDMTGYCGLFARCGCARCGGIMDDILFLRRIFFLLPLFLRNGVLLLPSRPTGPLRSLSTQPQPFWRCCNRRGIKELPTMGRLGSRVDAPLGLGMEKWIDVFKPWVLVKWRAG